MRSQSIQITIKFLAGGVLIALLASGCTWVKKTGDAELVRIVPADRVSDCRLIGSITTHTKDKLSVVNRKPAKVKTELETLAQNDAAEMGADTLVATSEISNGKQSFSAYSCLK